MKGSSELYYVPLKLNHIADLNSDQPVQKLALYRPITHVCHLSVRALQRLCFLVFLSTIPTFLEFHCGPVPRAREETFLVTISLSLPSL